MRTPAAAALRQADALLKKLRAPERSTLLSQVRIATSLRHTVRDDHDIPVGASKLGGRPDLPAGTAWPVWHRFQRPAKGNRAPRIDAAPTPLSFLAQLDLAELPFVSELLPERGVLSFFYDVEAQPWGFDPLDRDATRVLYSGGAALQRTEAPSGTVNSPAARIEGVLAPTLPASPPDPVEDDEPYWDLVDALFDHRPLHQLLGWPEEVQGEMEGECQGASHGIFMGGPEGYASAEYEAVKAGAADWRLLLQLDSDDAVEWQWGDLGHLYFWIREADLRERRFDRVWTVLQCG